MVTVAETPSIASIWLARLLSVVSLSSPLRWTDNGVGCRDLLVLVVDDEIELAVFWRELQASFLEGRVRVADAVDARQIGEAFGALGPANTAY